MPPQITSPLIFFGVAGLVVSYVLYTMIRRRKGDRPDSREREAEL